MPDCLIKYGIEVYQSSEKGESTMAGAKDKA